MLLRDMSMPPWEHQSCRGGARKGGDSYQREIHKGVMTRQGRVRGVL
jgi:hypothetical protein